MADDLSMQLRELRKSTDELNALTDKANDLVRRTESYLSEECRVGGPVHVHVPSLDQDIEPPGGPEWSTYLGYDRYKGELRIVVAHLLDGDEHEVNAWAECSRDIKLAALDALPKLIQEILKKVRKQVADVQAKVDLLDSIIPTSGGSQRRSSAPRRG
jgi:hypothetical protein